MSADREAARLTGIYREGLIRAMEREKILFGLLREYEQAMELERHVAAMDSAAYVDLRFRALDALDGSRAARGWSWAQTGNAT